MRFVSVEKRNRKHRIFRASACGGDSASPFLFSVTVQFYSPIHRGIVQFHLVDAAAGGRRILLVEYATLGILSVLAGVVRLELLCDLMACSAVMIRAVRRFLN
jgi:hypothetical protein